MNTIQKALIVLGTPFILTASDTYAAATKGKVAKVETVVTQDEDITVTPIESKANTLPAQKENKKVEANSNTANAWKAFTDNSLYANIGSESTGSETVQDDNVVDFTSKGMVPFGTLEAVVGMKKNNNRVLLGVNGEAYKLNFKDNVNGVETGNTKINHIEYAPGIGFEKDFRKADRIIKGADGKDKKVVDTLTHRLGAFVAYKGILDSIKQSYDIVDITKDRNANGIEATLVYNLLNKTAKVVEVRAGVSAASGDSKTNVSIPTLSVTNETTVPYKRNDLFGVVKVHYNWAALNLMLNNVSETEGDRESKYTELDTRIGYEINKYLEAGLGFRTILSGSADGSAYNGNRIYGGIKVHYDNENATYSSNRQPKATPTKTVPQTGKN